MTPARFLQPAFAFLAACMALAQQGAVPTPPPTPAAPQDEEDVPVTPDVWDFSTRRGLDPLMMERLNLAMPEGRTHEGLRYPVYREATAQPGPALESLFESQRVTRADENHLRFEGSVFSTFDDPKKPETATRTVSFINAIYDLKHNLLYTNSPVKIDDRRLSVHSGGMIHDRASGLTIFSGGVELFLHEPPPKPPVKPASGASAPPGNPQPPNQPANPKSP